jgi:hypothetical protein
MNKDLYDAVFGWGDMKIDPFAETEADFDSLISDMRLGGYEITALNVAEFIILKECDELNMIKQSIIEEAKDLNGRNEYCLENYGISFKDLYALEPKTDIEWDIKSGHVLIFLSGEAQYKEDAYMKIFGVPLQNFCRKTGFNYVKLGETM